MSSPNPTGTPHLFDVTGQAETTRVDDTGHVVTGVTVTFTDQHGLTGSVFVPQAAYNVATVRTAIMARLTVMQAVQSLQG